MGHDPLASVHVNVCRPNPITPPLTTPINLHLDLDPKPPPFRIFRVRSSEEIDLSTKFIDLLYRFSSRLPSIGRYTALLRGTPQDLDLLASQCDVIFRDLSKMREVLLPQNGFAERTPAEVDLGNPVVCRQATQAALLNHFTSHVSAIILRNWLSLSQDDVVVNSVRLKLQQACLENAERTMGTIPMIRALMACQHKPFIGPFASANLFNAATTFAIPVFRAVKIWTQRDGEEDVQALPLWPEKGYVDMLLPRGAQPNPTSLPSTIYIVHLEKLLKERVILRRRQFSRGKWVRLTIPQSVLIDELSQLLFRRVRQRARFE